jgi:3-methyladenine DNA glycosylase AlkC
MLSVKFYAKKLVKNHKNSHQEKENHLSNRIVKNWQKFVEIVLLIIPTDMKTIFPHKNQTVKLRIKNGLLGELLW